MRQAQIRNGNNPSQTKNFFKQTNNTERPRLNLQSRPACWMVANDTVICSRTTTTCHKVRSSKC